jgi:hypothetical protein
MLIVLLGPLIAIFCRHDTRYFFDFSLSSTACYGSRAKDSRLTLGTATAVMELSKEVNWSASWTRVLCFPR